MVTNVNLTCCGDHFPMYTNIESRSYTPETNTICRLYLKKEKRKENALTIIYRETTQPVWLQRDMLLM